MDALSSLFPMHQIGSDGFAWWIGQVETPTYRNDGEKDPKRSGRYKVRIVGHHPKSCTAVPTADLPWAITMMPVTDPYAAGATRSKSPRLEPGDWVVGFFLDREQQQPVIMGSIGQVANAAPEIVEDPTPGEGCKNFTTFLDPEVRQSDQPVDEGDFSSVEAGVPLSGGDNDDIDDEGPKPSLITNLSAAKRAETSETNRAGINFSVAVVTNCGEESNLKGTFNRLLSEMLRDVQQSNGKVGTYLVGQWTGDIYDTIDIGRRNINKAIRIMETFIAKVKGYIVEKIKMVIDDLIKAILRPDETGNALTPVTKFFNEMLKNLGCSMKDLGLRLQEFLEELLFNYLFSIYKAAACQVDKLVQGILNKIRALMEELLASVLGPLQDILGAIAEPLNLIGEAINYVLNLLGIQCDGPGKGCKQTTTVSTKCKTDKKENFLDKLLEDLEDPWEGAGADWATYTCEEAYEGVKLENTDVSIIGGTQPTVNVIEYDITDISVTEGEIAKFVVSRFGLTDISSSITFRTIAGTANYTDFQKSDGILGFSPGETEKEIEIQTYNDNQTEGVEDFFVDIRRATPDRNISAVKFKKSYGRCVIFESAVKTGLDTDLPPSAGGGNGGGINVPETILSELPENVVQDLTNNDSLTEPPEGTAKTSIRVDADRTSVKEGQFITYTITSENIPSGTGFNYRLSGTNITGSDIVGGNLQGSFVIEENKARVIVGIETDDVVESDEVLTFTIDGTGAAVSVVIEGDENDLSDEELLSEIDVRFPDGGDDSLQYTEPKRPTTKPVITDKDGGIIEVPIDEPGDPFIEPPVVIISGEGSGANAIALLDDKGRLAEIRVTSPGSGYKPNEPTEVSCIIDSFTMLSPGSGYKTPPTVYLNGIADKAEAIIDEQGFVISVRILDRETTYVDYPDVRILGGGGFGARYIPSFSCLDTDTLVKVGSAKIGTGRYIDCP